MGRQRRNSGRCTQTGGVFVVDLRENTRPAVSMGGPRAHPDPGRVSCLGRDRHKRRHTRRHTHDSVVHIRPTSPPCRFFPRLSHRSPQPPQPPTPPSRRLPPRTTLTRVSVLPQHLLSLLYPYKTLSPSRTLAGLSHSRPAAGLFCLCISLASLQASLLLNFLPVQ